MNRTGLVLFVTGMVSLTVLAGQSKRDARATALAGAYGSIADGIFAVGYNPALIAYQRDKPFMLQLLGLDYGIVSNYFSIKNLNSISGDTLSEEEKDLLFRNFERSQGLRLFTDLHIALPGLNFASGNMALTSNTILLGDFIFPVGLLRMMFYENAVGEEIDMTLSLDLLGVTEYGFSFAVPSTDYAWGVTLKYLQGLFYVGIDPDSSYASLTTDTTGMVGSGVYYIRQGIGGTGIGLDIGFTTRDFEGWRIGLSMINALGSITWNKPSLIKDIISGSDDRFGTKDDLFHFTWGNTILNDSMAVRYVYHVDTLNAQNTSNDSMFYSNPKSEQVVYNLTGDGKLKSFTTRYPALFRISVSKRFPDLLICSDLVTGFENRFFARDYWRWSVGAEFLRNPTFPIRLGFGYGGTDFKQLGMGVGYHKGPIIFDVGIAFRRGLWIHTLKGLNVSAGLTLTSFKSRKTAVEEVLPEGPAPEPAEQSEPAPEPTPSEAG